MGTRHFVCTSGNVTDEVIAEYVRTQGAELPDDAACTIRVVARREPRT